MSEKLYTNSEAIKILGMPQRQIINLTEKGVIVPVFDAIGAGSKRKYSYTNLLEFSLAQRLIELGININLVKMVLSNIRESGDLKKWNEDFRGYFRELASEYLVIVKSRRPPNGEPFWCLPDKVTGNFRKIDPENDNDIEFVIDFFSSKKQYVSVKERGGTLVYNFNDDGSSDIRIIPDHLRYSVGGTLIFNDKNCKATLMIKLGDIKCKIDNNINDK